MKYKIKMVKDSIDEVSNTTTSQADKKYKFSMSLSRKDLLYMKKKAGLTGVVTNQQIVSAYLKTMMNQY